MSNKYEYDFPKADHTVDIIVLRPNKARGWEILTIVRKDNPFSGCRALPGGFWDKGEDLEQTARRELREETTLKDEDATFPIQQFRTYSKPGRDPRGPVITTVFLAVVPEGTEALAEDDALEGSAEWLTLAECREVEFAFDHAMIIEEAITNGRISLNQLSAAIRK